MDAASINKKIELCEAATDLFMAGQFTISDLTSKTGYSASEIYSLFPNKKAILKYYYPSLLIRYRAMITEIPDFEDYTISEKLSNFIYTLFDMMDEKEAFVQKTYNEYIFSGFSKTDFGRETEELIGNFISEDPRVSNSAAVVLGGYFYSFIKSQYLMLIRYRIHDESDGRERSLALTDKLHAFLEELLYNKLADRGIDLLRTIIAQSGMTTDMNSFSRQISDMCCGSDNEQGIEIEIEDEDVPEQEENKDSDQGDDKKDE